MEPIRTSPCDLVPNDEVLHRLQAAVPDAALALEDRLQQDHVGDVPAPVRHEVRRRRPLVAHHDLGDELGRRCMNVRLEDQAITLVTSGWCR
jgi:hypothetical protein